MVCHCFKHNGEWRPLNLFVAAGQVSDYIGARALLSSIPNVGWRSVIVAMTPTGSETR